MTDPHDNSYGPAGWTGAWTESNWGGGTIPGTLPAPGSEEPRENPAAWPRGFALRNDAGYFGGGNLGRPLHTFPRCFLRIVPRNGQFYWHIDFPGGIGTERLPPEFSYCVFYLDKADSHLTGQLGDDTSTGVLVWELMLTKTEVEQIDVLMWERLISEQYFNGFFYARSKVGGRYGSPTALVTVPIYDFVIPEKIKEFSIAEDPTYVEGSAQVYSNLTIEYVPPDNLDGFWGVALYIEGYQDNDQPRLLQMREYNPEFNGYGDDTFQCILEPWAPVVLESSPSGNYVSGTPYTTDADNYWSNGSVGRFLKKDFLSSTQAGIFYTTIGNSALIPDWTTYSAPTINGKKFANNTGGTPEFKNPVRMNDVLLCSGETAIAVGNTFYFDNANTALPSCDNVEAIIRSTGDYADANKEGKLRVNMISSTFSDSASYINYAYWKIVRSCKFYLVSVNRSGYHGPFADNALSMYVALDGVASAPPLPVNVIARQYDNKNVIRFDYSGKLIEDIKQFCVYRAIYNQDPWAWERIGTIDAKDSLTLNDGVSIYSYEKSDSDIYASADTYGLYETEVVYGVSVVSKSGMESAIKECIHYDIKGASVYAIKISRSAGVNNSVHVVTRNNPFNLLWNAECSWDYDYDISYGIGNPNFYDWSLYTPDTNPTEEYSVNLLWDSAVNCFTLGPFALFADAQKWARLIGQTDIAAYPTFPTTGTTYTAASPESRGLGRTQVVMPGMNWSGIVWRMRYVAASRLLYLDFNTGSSPGLGGIPKRNAPPFTANRTWVPTTNSYYIDAGPWYFDALVITPIPVEPSAVFRKSYYRNGWWFKGQVAVKGWFEGCIPVEPDTSAVAEHHIRQRVRKGMFQNSQFFTFSCQVRRTVGMIFNAPGEMQISLYKYSGTNMAQETLIAGNQMGYSASVGLSQMTADYQYFVFYIDIGTNYDWSTLDYVDFVIAVKNQGTYTYEITRPILNVGNEATSFVTLLPSGITKLRTSSTPPFPFEPPDNRNGECIAFGQDAMLGNGETVKVEELENGSILRGWFTDADVKFNVHVLNVMHSTGKTRLIKLMGGHQMEVTDDHTCVCDGYLKAAKDIIPGEKMLIYHDGFTHKKVKVVSNCPTDEVKEIVKLECSYPHTLYLNRILTHNMKMGRQ